VSGEDGELQWIDTRGASTEALEDAITILRNRGMMITADIQALRRLLAARKAERRAKPQVCPPVEVRHVHHPVILKPIFGRRS
jgi:hypothetical protein